MVKVKPEAEPEAPKKKPDEVRLVVELPRAVHRKLKARAAEEGLTIREFVLALLKEKGIG